MSSLAQGWANESVAGHPKAIAEYGLCICDIVACPWAP